jgi:hypothetical protein
VIDSYKNLLPDSGTNTVTLLTQISQQLSNGSQIPPPASVPPFQPPTSAICVNALWFLSLVISLFCALLATLQQSWARRYLRFTNTQCAIHKRARLRAFFAEGVDRFYLPFAVEAIPTLIHISVFLFFTGLVISLFSIHHTIAWIIFAATVICGFMYMGITVMPVLHHNSPYQSPLSALTWAVTRGIAKKMSMSEAAEDAAERQDESIYARALSWTLDQSQEENELEKVISGIPKFAHSIKVTNPMKVLKEAVNRSTLRPHLFRDVTTLLINATLPGFLHGYKELSKDVRERRKEICLEALLFIPDGITTILRRVSKNLKDEKINCAFAPLLESKRAWQIARRPEFWNPRTLPRTEKTEALERAIIRARCVACAIASRTGLPGEVKPDNMNEGSRNSFLLKILNRFLEDVALEFIDIERTDILRSTVRIVTEKLQLNFAAKELRVEFEGYFTRLINLERDQSQSVRENAGDLRSVLASLRNPPSGNGSPPPPMAQIDSPAAMSPVSPIQAPPPMASSPPPGDVYISMPSYPSTPSGETPLMPMPSHHPPSPHSAIR